MDASAVLDGKTVFDALIETQQNSAGTNSVDVRYNSILGTTFDNTEMSDILAHLMTDSSGDIVLTGSFDLFPLYDLTITPGDHVFSQGLTTFDTVPVPEPGSISFLGLGFCALTLIGIRARARLI